jgi:hypothetical protein
MRLLIIMVLSLLFAGCGHVEEFSKTVWGSSTRALEEARVNGIIKTYNCTVSRCYDEALKAVQDAKYTVFIDNKLKATIVVMGIKGSVNTTEVGIFFSDISDTQTKIYISSLSSNAKRSVAQQVLPKLDEVFGVEESGSTTTIGQE